MGYMEESLAEGEALASAEAGSMRGGKLPGSSIAELPLLLWDSRCQAKRCWAA